MIPRAVRVRWARKLLGAKYFVVLTDKESVIALAGVNPESFTDALALASQSAEIEMFYNSLGDLMKDHKKALNKLNRMNNATINRREDRPTTGPREVQTTVRRHNAKKI